MIYCKRYINNPKNVSLQMENAGKLASGQLSLVSQNQILSTSSRMNCILYNPIQQVHYKLQCSVFVVCTVVYFSIEVIVSAGVEIRGVLNILPSSYL